MNLQNLVKQHAGDRKWIKSVQQQAEILIIDGGQGMGDILGKFGNDNDSAMGKIKGMFS
ncbi:MAG: hypothetical protein WKG06_36615 [Segetibacter sp.]